MADDKTPDGRSERIEPTLDMNPQTDRSPNSEAIDHMMASLDVEFGQGDAADESPRDTNVEDELRAEIAVLKDQLLRSLAEVENVRRRVEREKQDMNKYAVANFAKAVLPVADNLERALSAASPEARVKDDNLKNLCVGLELTQNELRATLDKFGVKQVDAMHKRLDPNLHQAMFEIDDTSKPVGTILQIMQHGYTIHDRLLRPAMVGVSKGGPKDGAAPVAPANENPGPGATASNAYGKSDQTGGDSSGKAIDKEL